MSRGRKYDDEPSGDAPIFAYAIVNLADGHTDTLAYEPWPKFDAELAKADEIEIPVQVNGKLKAKLMVPAETDEKGLEAAALADPKVQEQIAGKAVKMIKVVPRRLVNIVVS